MDLHPPSALAHAIYRIQRFLCIATLTFLIAAPLQGSLLEVRFDVTRQDFEQGCAPLFERALAPVTRLLGDLGEKKQPMHRHSSRVGEEEGEGWSH